jgi:hypothetical protein
MRRGAAISVGITDDMDLNAKHGQTVTGGA